MIPNYINLSIGEPPAETIVFKLFLCYINVKQKEYVRMYKKIAFLFVISMLILSSCGGTKNSSKIKVDFWHVMGGPANEALEELVSRFTAENPDIEIVLVSVGNYEQLSQKLMAATKNPPVMSQVYESWTSEFFDAGLLAPVEELCTQDYLEEIKKDVYPILIEDNTFGGKLVSMPFNKSVPAYFYNRDLYEKNRISSFPETWAEFKSDMKKMTYDENGDGVIDIHGTAFNVNVWLFECRLFQYGGELADSAMNPLFDSQSGIRAVQDDYDMIVKDKSAYITTGYQHQDDFLSKKITTMNGSCVSLSFIEESKPDFKLCIAPIPYGDRKAAVISGTNVAVFNRASKEQKEAAMKFIKFFTSAPSQAYWSYKTGYLPVRRSSLGDSLLIKRFSEVEGLESVYRQIDNAYLEPKAKEWYIGRKLLGNALEYALKNSKTIQKALTDAADEFRKEIKQ